MKNYIIGFLAICLLVVLSFTYKISKTPVFEDFPVNINTSGENRGEPKLFIYFFFSKQNCPTCLDAIEVLNQLPGQFKVIGIVPADELKNESGIRNTTGANFELISFNESHRKFKPYYIPSIYGVSENGEILFVLPGVPGEKEYLYDFLVSFYGKGIHLLFPGIRE